MDRLLRIKQAIIRRIETAAGTDTPGLLLELKSGMTFKRSGIDKINTIHATGALIGAEKPLLSLKYGLNSEATKYGWKTR